MAGKEFERLVDIMEKLRGENGCPWDKKQTFESLLSYVLEEAYEVVDAVKREDYVLLKEELGDLLLQVVFQAQIAKEKGLFDIEDVIKGINEKLIRRHPHVFGSESFKDSDEVLLNWERMKREEKSKRSILDGVPLHIPALLRAYELQERARRVGFDWDKTEDVMKKIEEEWEEFKEAYSKKDLKKMEEEVGDLLFAIVNLARFIGANPELVLHAVNEKFRKRFLYIEEKAREKNRPLSSFSLEEMESWWEEAKKREVQ
ncbi:MAG: nucleoside triphosphate pyrophosphohydrolase [Synergistetes bacterium]|nr:nucleoside triphosphate pyrophosphohydrolase [Synergistota bacterium]MCX8127297.1 nucleoside triphosphate pyrophosphohydrolase [Synergistota bacterium]MDW8191817.1 nucleoside triphosphate pyrophosphohydrolase [Synergistota bacterium]